MEKRQEYVSIGCGHLGKKGVKKAQENDQSIIVFKIGTLVHLHF